MEINFKKEKGFTLIELLVVVAIISLLASVVLASLSTARGKGRDAKRLADVEQIRTALQLYWIDNGGAYPSTGGAPLWYGNCAAWPTAAPGTHNLLTGATGYIPNLAPTYIPVLPVDPKPTSTSNCYIYSSNGTDYMFLVYGTVEGTVPTSLKRPSATGEQDYAVYTPGASTW
jgi:prepilin-type N-terminal cleavage/methylation domain-containing protein